MYYYQPLGEFSWSTQTLYFYLAVIVACYFFSKQDQVIILLNRYTNTSSSWGMILVGGILVFVKGFSTTGKDLIQGYYLSFESALSFKNIRDPTLEYGYQLLNIVIRNTVGQYWFFVLVIGLLTVIPVCQIVWKYHNEIDVSIAILMYVSIFYYPSFSLIRIYMASSIALFAFASMLYDKKIRALIYIIIASFFHVSMLVLLIPYTIYFFKKISLGVWGVILVLLTIIIFSSKSYLLGFFGGRYAGYALNNASNGIGMEQFIYYVPIILLVLYGKYYDEDMSFYSLSMSYLMSGLFAGIIGYEITIFGRIQAAFLPIIIIVAYYVQKIKTDSPYQGRFIEFLVIIYSLTRCVIYLSQYYNIDNIMPYTNIFNWII
ncbi:EpsG family protein [Lactobacillus sp. AN1001]